MASVSQSEALAPSAEVRHTFIGGSEAFELIGEKHYGRGCARALAYRKLETPEDVPTESAKQRAISMRGLFKRGHLLEDIAAQLYAEDTGRALIRRNRLVLNADHPGAGVHTDRIILARPSEGKPTGDAEIKTHGEGPFLNILRNGLPAAHSLQLQWSLFCTGHQWGAFIVLGVFGEMPLKHFDRERDPALMNIFAAAVDNFWNTLKAGDLPPQLPDPSDLRCKVCPFRLTCRGESLDPAEFERLMRDKDRKKPVKSVRNDELDEAIADRELILSEMEALDHESTDPEKMGALQIVTARIRELLGDDEAVEVNDRWTVYHSGITWSGLDQQRLRDEQPEIFKRYYIDKRPVDRKRLRVYPVKNRRSQ